MPKTIAIYFSDSGPYGYPFDKQEYLEAYSELIRRMESQEIDVHIVRGDSYDGKGRFSGGWKLNEEGSFVASGPVQADLIFNRDDKNTIPRITDCPIINHPDFDELCTDKVKTAKAFADISPLTAAIASFADLKARLDEWRLEPGGMIVLKKNFETEGRGIFILPVSEVAESLYESWNDVLMQEYLDSGVGVPGLAEGRHDLRVTVIDGIPVNSYLRIPPEGSYIANVARGGTGKAILLSDVPTEVIEMTNSITEKVSQYSPLIFAADFIRSPKGYRLIELNSRPGLQHKTWSANYKDFNDAVAEMLVKAVS